ncbi:MAG TPA: methyltransferase domain-containing protein [Myxococcales bacterium]|nr:methyltransferase domain-containing protein [Myxococcales bacterium]
MAAPCPVCGGQACVPAHAAVRDFEHGLPTSSSFLECPECGLVFQTPQPTLDALLSYYPPDYRPHVSGSRDGLLGLLKGVQSRLLVSRYARWLPADRAAAIVDLGCGSGQFLQALAHAGYTNLTGVDRNPALAARFEGTPIRYLARELEPNLELEGRYQTIVMNNVLEHFLDPGRVLARCRELLEPGGQILVLTPDAGSWSHQLFGAYWSGLHAPRHPLVFSRPALERLARAAELRDVRVASVTDPASWAFSFQNWVRSHGKAQGVARGTAWYGLASLPLWAPFALAERAAGRSSSLVASLRA